MEPKVKIIFYKNKYLGPGKYLKIVLIKNNQPIGCYDELGRAVDVANEINHSDIEIECDES